MTKNPVFRFLLLSLHIKIFFLFLLTIKYINVSKTYAVKSGSANVMRDYYYQSRRKCISTIAETANKTS